MTEVTELDAATLAARARSGELSVRAIVDAHIRRIEEVDDHLNAVVIRCFDEARRAALAADDRVARGEPTGPLHGVPVTIKEQFRVAGTQTTLGASSHVGKIQHDEGPLVTQLRQAGAIVLGKTNILQTLAGWESDNPVYGRSLNPWNADRTPGGSSGGEAAIVAVGGSALGLAGDFGGSIRVPAHFCGVHGLKPTSGRLTNDDFPAGLLGNGQELFIPQPGPIARSVADLSLAMEVMAETSLSFTSDGVPPVPWPDPRQINVQGMRIGYYETNGLFSAAPAIRRVVREAAAMLEEQGASVAPIAPPDPAEGMRLFLGAVSAGGGGDYLRLLDGEKPIPQVAGLFRGFTSTPSLVTSILQKILNWRGQQHLARMVGWMGPRSTEAYWQLVEQRTAYRNRFLRSLDEGGFDALVCPPTALPALTHGSTQHLFAAFTDAYTYNVLGFPAGVVAASRVRPDEESDGERLPSRDLTNITAQAVEQGSAGLPVGVQVVARPWREDIVLALMHALEQAFAAGSDYPAGSAFDATMRR